MRLFVSDGCGFWVNTTPNDGAFEVEVPDRIAERLLSVIPGDGALSIPCVGHAHITVGINLQAVARKLMVCFQLRKGWAELENELHHHSCGPGIYQAAVEVARGFRTGGYAASYDNMTMAQAIANNSDTPYGIDRAVAAFEAVTGAKLENFASSRHGFDILRVAAQMWRESGHKSWPDDGHTVADLAKKFNRV